MSSRCSEFRLHARGWRHRWYLNPWGWIREFSRRKGPRSQPWITAAFQSKHGCVVRIQWNDMCTLNVLGIFIKNQQAYAHPSYPLLAPTSTGSPIPHPRDLDLENSSLFRKEVHREKKILFSPWRLQGGKFSGLFSNLECWTFSHSNINSF